MLAPVLALAGVLGGTACSGSAASSTAPAKADAAVAPALTQAEAAQVFGHYTAVTAEAARTEDSKLLLSVLTGVQRAVVSAPRGSQSFSVVATGGPSSSPSTGDSSGAYSSTLTIEVSSVLESYRDPAFYLPQPAGYPRFLVAQASQAGPGLPASLHLDTVLAETEQPLDGTAVLLFEQASRAAPWLLASASELSPGQALPRFATDSSGHIPVAKASAALLTAPLNSVGALQAAAVDEGPSSPAMKAVAAGPLTTGIYQGAENHADGLQAPRGDVYQWRLEGTQDPVFALRTATGGALTFYTMTMTETVAVPGVIGKADPVRSGPEIQVPPVLKAMLPKDQQGPLQELRSQQTLSFAALDPARAAKITVIAIGGGLTSVTAS